MSKKSNATEVKSERKKPVRNPERKLFMEKARIEFEQSELAKKKVEETAKHAQSMSAIDKKSIANKERLKEIEEGILKFKNQELFPNQD